MQLEGNRAMFCFIQKGFQGKACNLQSSGPNWATEIQLELCHEGGLLQVLMFLVEGRFAQKDQFTALVVPRVTRLGQSFPTM